MFRIRSVHDDVSPRNRKAIEQVQEILASHFAGLSNEEIVMIPEQLRDPLKFQFKSTLMVAENAKGTVHGFGLLFYAPDVNFCFLDFLATKKGKISQGIGAAIYDRIRDQARKLKVWGLFLECLPDDAALCQDKSLLKQNQARLKFYENFGARPIYQTKYETPLNPGDDCPPYLVYDNLDSEQELTKKIARKIVVAILKRKYGDLCSQEYIRMVVNSIEDDPVLLRPFRYIKIKDSKSLENNRPRQISSRQITVIINDQHHIHHIKDRGYVESPVRVNAILRQFDKVNIFKYIPMSTYREKFIYNVHSHHLVNFLKRSCMGIHGDKSIYPYVFPIRNANRPPRDDSVLAGYYCIDTFTPINRNAFIAAKKAVDCALTAADIILGNHSIAYALVRPPGHHAETKVFGGFCYLNSTAIAAHYLSEYGKVAILDVDYHHGNGQQEIFYQRHDVLTMSIHGHPNFSYPYFSGFRDEKGAGEGYGFNINFPLKEELNGEEYLNILQRCLQLIRKFKPDYLVIALGLDTAKGDPTGTWSLSQDDFFNNGLAIGELNLPTVVVQEGGYKTNALGNNAVMFFKGLWSSFFFF